MSEQYPHLSSFPISNLVAYVQNAALAERREELHQTFKALDRELLIENGQIQQQMTVVSTEMQKLKEMLDEWISKTQNHVEDAGVEVADVLKKQTEALEEMSVKKDEGHDNGEGTSVQEAPRKRRGRPRKGET